MPNLAGIVLGWSPFKIVSNSYTLHSRWQPLLKIDISLIVYCCCSIGKKSPNFNCIYMSMSSLTYLPVFSVKYLWHILIKYHINLFCWNRWTKLNQIWLGWSLALGGDPLYAWQPSLNLRWQPILKMKISLFVDASILVKMSSNFYYSCMAINSSKYICINRAQDYCLFFFFP